MAINNELNKFPFHPCLNVDMDKINNMNLTVCELRMIKTNLEKKKKISDNILLSGLLIDDEYDVFLHPEYGAFFYNTSCRSMQEEIESCNNILVRMDYHCYVPQEELLTYIDNGYEFVMGPSVKIFDNDSETLNGVYCANYKKKLNKKNHRYYRY